MQLVWYTLLVSSICLEGLGRKYLPAIPPLFFYFLKDLVLIYGYFAFPRPPLVGRTVRLLYGSFGVVIALAIAWTAMEMTNSVPRSWMLALIGLRAYWLWWLAPPVIASFLQDERRKRSAIYVLLGIAVVVSVMAAFQFASPADSELNLYSVADGEEIHASDMATVAATGRARVASTFTFLSGFADFCLLVPALLLSIGLEAREKRVRYGALIATGCSAAVIPMSGSRASVLVGAGILLVMAWASGLFFTRVGRRVLVAGVVAAILAVVAFPDAIFGVETRFENSGETTSRLMEAATILPPVALGYYDYPFLGLGTGMQQNARISLQVDTDYNAEAEAARYLVELGPIGYLLIWTARLGLVVALLRCYAILKRAGRRGPAGAALVYAAVTFLGDLTFDHVWQALYFLGCGFILSEVVSVRRGQALRELDLAAEGEADSRLVVARASLQDPSGSAALRSYPA